MRVDSNKATATCSVVPQGSNERVLLIKWQCAQMSKSIPAGDSRSLNTREGRLTIPASPKLVPRS